MGSFYYKKARGTEQGSCFDVQAVSGEVDVFLEDMRGSDGTVANDVYSIITSEPSHSLHLGVSRFLKRFVVQYLSSSEIISQPGGRTGKQKRLSSLKLRRLKACDATLAHNDEKYPGSGSACRLS